MPEQIAPLLAVTEGLLDHVDIDQMSTVEAAIQADIDRGAPDICERILDGQKLSVADKVELSNHIKHVMPE